MKKKHQSFAALGFLWAIALFLFGGALPWEIYRGRSSTPTIIFSALFGIVFVGVLISLTRAYVKHRRDDKYFDELPPE